LRQQQQQQQQFISPPHTSIQPHINPRFAARFGLNMDMMQPQQQYLASNQYGTQTMPVYGSSWDGQWNQSYDVESDHVKYDHDHNGSGA
jgi:hypothetical protein